MATYMLCIVRSDIEIYSVNSFDSSDQWGRSDQRTKKKKKEKYFIFFYAAKYARGYSFVLDLSCRFGRSADDQMEDGRT